MKTLHKLLLSLIGSLNFITLSNLYGRDEDKVTITNNTESEEKDSTGKPIRPAINFDLEMIIGVNQYEEGGSKGREGSFKSHVQTIKPNQTVKISEQTYFPSYIQALNIWQAGADRKNPGNFIGVFLPDKGAGNFRDLTCTLKRKTQSETSKFSPLEQLEKGMFKLHCNEKGTFLDGTSLGWTNRGGID